jgi:hypothetical protein
MNRIIKVIYQDGSELEPKNIIPLVIDEDKTQQWRNQIKYNRQFKSFEEDILDDLDEDTVEDYAKYRFDLTEELDKEDEKKIDDFSDEEIMEEVRDRKLLGNCNSIISEQFITRFSKIMEKESQILLDNLLSEFENKLNI